MKKNLLQSIFILALLTFTQHSFAGSLTAKVDRLQISMGESLTLTVAMDGSSDTEPDFAPILENFDQVNGISTRNFSSFTNGEYSSGTRWQVMLTPKRAGNLVIPPLQAGKLRSQAITINVTKASNPTANSDTLYFIDGNIDTSSPYVQQQVIYTARVYFSEKLLVSNFKLKPPQTPNVVIKTLGEQKQYNKIIEGETYLVAEQQFALFPQTSGEVTLPGVAFSAVVSGRNSRRSMYNQGKSVFKKSTNLDLKVKAIPISFKGKQWLPAKNISVQSAWSESNPTLTVGQAMTRTITLRAEGLSKEQIPPADTQKIDGIKNYQDQPKQEEYIYPHGLLTIQTVSQAIIPNKTGIITLPATNIHWWNTDTDQAQTTTLAAETFNVIADSDATPPKSTSPLITNSSEEIRAANQTTIKNQDSLNGTSISSLWFYVSLSLFALCVFLIAFSAYLYRQLKALKPKKEELELQDNDQLTKNQYKKSKQLLISSMNNSDLSGIKLSLIHWAKQYTSQKDIYSLGDIKNITSMHLEIINYINALERKLYQSEDTKNEKDLEMVTSQAFINWLKNSEPQRTKEKIQQSILPPLYQ